MTQIQSARKLIVASTFGAVTAVIMLAQAGQASAESGVLSCEGANRRAVLNCCEERVSKYGLPLWMRQVGAHCSTPQIVKCRRSPLAAAAAAGVSKPCKIVKIQIDDSNDKDRGRGNRGKGGRGNGGNGPRI